MLLLQIFDIVWPAIRQKAVLHIRSAVSNVVLRTNFRHCPQKCVPLVQAYFQTKFRSHARLEQNLFIRRQYAYAETNPDDSPGGLGDFFGVFFFGMINPAKSKYFLYSPKYFC